MPFKITEQALELKNKEHPKLAQWYINYLASDEWTYRKSKLLKARGEKCELCPSVEDLVCHHLTYAHVCYEWERDLQILCRTCHSEIKHYQIPWIDRIYDNDYKGNSAKKWRAK